MRRVIPGDRKMIEFLMNAHIKGLAPGLLRLSADPFYANKGNVGYCDDEGMNFVLFEQLGGHRYGAHLLCVRGAVALGRQAVAAIFTVHGAAAIQSEIPRSNLRSRVVCRAVGGIPTADTVDAFGRPCKLYKLSAKRWAALSGASRAA